MKLGHGSLWFAILLVMGYAVAQNPLPPAPDRPESEDSGAEAEGGAAPAFEDEFDRAAGLGDQAAGQARNDFGPGGPQPLPPAAGRQRPVPRQDEPGGGRRPMPPRERAREQFRGAEQPDPEGEFGPHERGPREREGDFGPESEPGPRRERDFEGERGPRRGRDVGGERGPRRDGARPPFDRRPREDLPMRGREGDLEQLRQRDPKMAELIQQDMELERASAELAEQFRRAGPDRQEEIRGELAEVVRRHFEVRQQRRELEIVRLTEQLERLQASLKRRAENKETVIKQRVAQLLGEDVIDF